jgi:type I restriction enzyme R subunit
MKLRMLPRKSNSVCGDTSEGAWFRPGPPHRSQRIHPYPGAALRGDAVYTSDDAKRRLEIMARQIFVRFKALLMQPSVFAYAERHDNIEAIYKKLKEKRDTADVTKLLKELHKIVNQAIQAQAPGEDHAEGLSVDLSLIDFEKLRDEFARKVRRKHAALQDIRQLIEDKLAQMLARNPMLMALADNIESSSPPS